MKTCPNCQATRIPDSAQFCPKCGELLVDTNTPWQEKCKELNKEKQKLQNEKREWTLFNKERNKMLSVLRQNSDFESEMKASFDAIHYNCAILPWKEMCDKLIGLAIMIVSVLIVVLPAHYHNDFPEWLNSEWLQILSWIVAIFLLIGGFTILTGNSNIIDIEKRPFYNHYISDFYMPFIERHRSEYQSLIVYSDSESIIWVEIMEPERITKGVEQYMEKTNRRIEELDKQIQLMKDIM